MSERRRADLRHVSRVVPARMGPLRMRGLDRGLLGDFSVIHEHLPPRTALPTIHHRNTAELVYCTAGAMTAYLDGRPRKVRAGTVILIPPGVRHRFVTGARACEALSLFSPALSVAPGGDIHLDDPLPTQLKARGRRSA